MDRVRRDCKRPGFLRSWDSDESGEANYMLARCTYIWRSNFDQRNPDARVKESSGEIFKLLIEVRAELELTFLPRTTQHP